MKNPICVVANYLFDTLYHDVFQVSREKLYEGFISVGSKRKEDQDDPLNPEIINRLENTYAYNEVSTDYYSDESEEGDAIHLNRMLEWYKNYFGKSPSGASLLIPIGALRALRRLSALSGGRALVR